MVTRSNQAPCERLPRIRDVADRARIRYANENPVAPIPLPHSKGDQAKVDPDCFAALDLGTNNCRLLIARPVQGGFQVVDSFSKITRLGEGLKKTGILSPAAIERTVDALSICSERISRANPKKTRCVATAACRMASNSLDFIRQVNARTGIDLEVISPGEEARLTLGGCLPLLSVTTPLTLLFDIGGGSTELTLAEVKSTPFGPVPGAVLAMDSLPFGVVTLSEAVGGGHLSRRLHNDIVAYVTRYLADFDPHETLRHSARKGELAVLGTSGTVTTAGAIVLNLPRYDRARVDGLMLPVDRLKTVGEMLLSMSPKDRINHPCIGRDRADLVLAGSAILEAILRFWPVPEIRVADRGVREGLLVEMMRGAKNIPPSVAMSRRQFEEAHRPRCVGASLDVAS